MIYLYLVAIFILTLALLLTIGVALVYFGLFERITVKTGPTPFPFTGAEFAYKIGKGKAADATVVFTEACSIVPRKATIGLYLELEESEADNPIVAQRKTRLGAFTRLFNPVSDDCHYVVGVITTPSPDYKPESFATVTDPEDPVNKPASAEERKLLLKKGFRFGRLPTSSDNVVYATFPFRGIISIAIGIRRVYSVIAEYIEHHRLCAYPFIELYDRDSIYYIMPLSQQDQFTGLFSTEEAAVDDDDNTSIDDEDTEIEEGEEEEDESTGNSTSSFEEL